MKFRQGFWIAGCLGLLTVPRIVSAHCGFCGEGESKSGSPSAAASVQDPMDALAQELKLSEDQKTKIKAIKEEIHKQMDALHQNAHAQINSVLTKEQQEKFAKSAAMHCDTCAKHQDPGKAQDHKH